MTTRVRYIVSTAMNDIDRELSASSSSWRVLRCISCYAVFASALITSLGCRTDPVVVSEEKDSRKDVKDQLVARNEEPSHRAAPGTASMRSRRSAAANSDQHRPIEVLADRYVSSDACRDCHKHQFDTWYATYHRTMTQLATPETVVGSFDDVTLTSGDKAYRLQRRGTEFWAIIQDHGSHAAAGSSGGSSSPSLEKRLIMTTGSHHQQAYWFSTGKKRQLDVLPFVFLISQQRWIPLESIFLSPPNQPRFEKRLGLWNMSCIRCHTTHGQPRLGRDESMDTHVAEFGIACEACHGPGQQHVRFQQGSGHGESDSMIVQPSKLSHQLASHVCAQCHSIHQFYDQQAEEFWAQHGYQYRPGDDLSKTRNLVRYSTNPTQRRLQGILHYHPHYMEDSFWPDGMVRVSGREYNGLQESPCFQRGEMSCLSCHILHKSPDDSRSVGEWANDLLKPNMEGNEACLQCHSRFRTKLQQHTRHKSSSSGSQCYNCHMPHTSYGLMKAIRSHQIDIPSVATNLETGRPNACNLCHLDKTLSWTSAQLSEWTKTSRPVLTDDEENVAASLLWLLRGDAGQRALIAWSMGWKSAQQTSGSDWLAPYLAQLLTDPYDPVRAVAHRSLGSLRGFGRFPYDFMGPDNEREEAKQRALRIWSSQRADKSQTGSAILIEPNSELRTEAIDRLLQQRDDRRVNLNE